MIFGTLFSTTRGIEFLLSYTLAEIEPSILIKCIILESYTSIPLMFKIASTIDLVGTIFPKLYE